MLESPVSSTHRLTSRSSVDALHGIIDLAGDNSSNFGNPTMSEWIEIRKVVDTRCTKVVARWFTINPHLCRCP